MKAQYSTMSLPLGSMRQLMWSIGMIFVGTLVGYNLQLTGYANTPANQSTEKGIFSVASLSSHVNTVNQVVAKHVDFDWKRAIESGQITSLPGTTGVGVPGKIKEWLLSSGTPIEEDALDFYGSEAAVKKVEDDVCGGWDLDKTEFGKDCTSPLQFGEYASHDQDDGMLPDPSEIDIVTPSIRNLDFLNEWQEFFQGFHIIIIQDGDQSVFLEIPDWVDYELHKRVDIERAMGEDNWIISQRDASIRNYGFLVSKKRFIFTIDDDCRPAYDSRGYKINPLAFHYRNLKTPSTPYMLNTLYDPYKEGSDFVRGYPYSLRSGVPTAVSHGIWMNQPDYDAPTQLLKVKERVTQMHEMVLTVPAGIFYPLCSMNLAFDRVLIGPAIMQGLMGDGMPWARYDDMFSGWASKSVADHLGVGSKSGMPYIRHNKASNPFINLKKEYKGLWWQEIVLRFFMTEVEYTSDADTPTKAYKELAQQIRTKLTSTHQYFDKLATAMELWTNYWDLAASGDLVSSPSRQNDPRLSPINVGYYSKLAYKTEDGTNLNLVQDNEIHEFDEEIEKMFPTIGHSARSSVTKHDIVVGHQWKTYILPLDDKYHEEVFKHLISLNTDCFTQSCDVNTISQGGFQWTDYVAEIVILRKLLGSLNFVSTLKDADLVLVPALGVSLILQCRNHGRCRNALFEELAADIVKKSDTTKKHLFLASQDSSQNHNFFKALKNDIVVSLGPLSHQDGDGLVVPSLNSERDLQPKNWKGCKPFSERNTFLLANFGVRGPDRIAITAALDEYTGNKTVTRINPKPTEDGLSDSVMTICPTGDLPYQKRFFDSLLHCSIPVVIKRKIDSNGGAETYWSNMNYEGLPSSTVLDSYPQLDFPYADIVVELDADALDFGHMMEYLESLPQDDLQEKFNKIQKVRSQFLYNFDGSADDAFSVMLNSLWEKHMKHLAVQ